MSTPTVIDVAWLAQRLEDQRLRLFDVRWYLPSTGKSGRAAYEVGHLPGAQFIDLDSELARPPAEGPGRHPLPTAEAFARTMSAAGVGPDTHVIAYDDIGGAIASRLWWLLRYFGHAQVSVLDGGIDRWVAGGHAISTEAVKVEPAEFSALPDASRVVDKRDVERLRTQADVLLLDARAAPRYEGRTEPMDARAGHIPGAHSAPFSGNLAGGALHRPEALRERFGALGADRKQTIVYCGSGVTACHNLLALEIAGLPPARLYEGSWSDWAADESLPLATGPDPGEAG